MTSSFFDAGDLQRLDRERTLTEQAPRVLPEEDRSPEETFENPYDSMLDGLLDALNRRLQ